MTTASSTHEPNHSNVVVFPPLIPLAGVAIGLALGRLVPLAPPPVALRAVGAVVLAVGVAGFAWMVITMRRARTPIHNAKTPTALVESGPFRRTRNPMYLFGSTGYAGLSLLTGQLWVLAMLPLVFAGQHYGAVLREEAFLERWFGDAYRDYKARVPRWL